MRLAVKIAPALNKYFDRQETSIFALKVAIFFTSGGNEVCLVSLKQNPIVGCVLVFRQSAHPL